MPDYHDVLFLERIKLKTELEKQGVEVPEEVEREITEHIKRKIQRRQIYI